MYLCLIRNNAGAYLEKVTLSADILFCKSVLQAMIAANKNATRAEIIEGNRDYIGDFHVKPLNTFKVIDGSLVEVL